MEQLLLVYLFVCFSVGLVCMGVTVVMTLRTRSPVARAFLAFYVAVTLLVLASLLLAFLDVVPGSAAPATRAVLEYLESMVGFYGVLFTLPFFAHRLFEVPGHVRDYSVLGIVALAFVLQHITEYGFGGSRWDDLGDRIEDVLFASVFLYTVALGVRRLNAPGVDRPLARRFLLLFGLGIPVLAHDLFFAESTARELRIYPLAYSVFSVVFLWSLHRRAGSSAGGTVPPEWNLSERETEVAMLIARGLSNKEIAAELFISLNTVKTHVRAVFDKSGCRSRFVLMAAIGPSPPRMS